MTLEVAVGWENIFCRWYKARAPFAAELGLPSLSRLLQVQPTTGFFARLASPDFHTYNRSSSPSIVPIFLFLPLDLIKLSQ
jgi:hypothetical protein